MEPILKVKELTVSIGAKRVMDGVSLCLTKGEVTALLGESGSGKTMTALALIRLLPEVCKVNSGSIELDGTDMMSLTDKQMRSLRGGRISMVFQEPFTALNPVIRIGEQIKEVLVAHSVTKGSLREARVKELLDMVKLPGDICSRYPHEISGGQRQRAMLAMAMAARPEVLILDEPTTALDVSVQKHILDIIIDLQKREHFAVLFITHDFSVANLIADNVYVMKEGKVLESGLKEKVLASPHHPYTKQLIECIPRLGDTRSRLPYNG